MALIIHVVKPGESVSSIAKLYGVPASKIIADNELANPNQLSVGQTLVILKATQSYTVRSGDTLYAIAQRYGVTVNDILASNPQIKDPAMIYPGQVIQIPGAGQTAYTVKSGDTLYAIARRYGVTVDDILESNPQITDPELIYPGQVIAIPSPGGQKSTIVVNGYIYPSNDTRTLTKTAPYLTYVSIFSYMVNGDGSLVPIDDEAMVRAAKNAGVAPLMVINNRRFNSDVASELLYSQAAQDRLIDNVLNILSSKGYYGLNIDFEYVYPSDREAYNRFLAKMAAAMRQNGYIISSAVAPKYSATQSGILYEAHDYPVHGRLMDFVVIMTYEWGYRYGPPMAISPIPQVKRVLDYAVTAIPPQKILMGMPDYGYDWTEGEKPAEHLSYVQAVNRAYEVGADIQFDPVAVAPFYKYYDAQGRQHTVWFNDARSVQAQLKLVDQYGLLGISVWMIVDYFPQFWLVLNSMYNVQKVL
jgi:spore germination protein